MPCTTPAALKRENWQTADREQEELRVTGAITGDDAAVVVELVVEVDSAVVARAVVGVGPQRPELCCMTAHDGRNLWR